MKMVEKWQILEEKIIPIEGESWIVRKEVVFLNPLTGKEKKYNLFGLCVGYGSTIVPITKDNKVIALFEYMQGVDEILLKLPGGAANFKGENPLILAERELIEETGYKGKEILALVDDFDREPRNSWNSTYTFLAKGCKKVKEQQCDFDEEIELKFFSFKKWMEMVRGGEIKEAGAIIASYRAEDYFKKYGCF